ncbi:MAG: hypothetical protein QW514_10195 [Thermoprotei archaeon]
MHSGIFVLGLIVMFAGVLVITPTFRLMPIIITLIGVVIAAVGAVLPKRVTVAQTVKQ